MTDVEVLRSLARAARLRPGRAATQRQLNPRRTAHFVGEEDAAVELRTGIELLAHYQERLSAQRSDALLVVLQGLDASGKDGAIKHVMSGVNPQGVSVHSYAAPTAEELARDFLWRHERDLPPRGRIAVCNRSHYEEVLVVRVHPELLEHRGLSTNPGAAFWTARFRAINEWERRLSESRVRVLKIFLNVSRAEQRDRLLARIDDPAKNWKFSMEDVRERRHWNQYQAAYRDMLRRSGTAWAPWHVVPADRKWFARVVVAALVVDALAEIDPRFPAAGRSAKAALQEARRALLRE